MTSKNLAAPELTFREVIHRLRYWLAVKNIPNADKVRIEIHFPNHNAQHYAAMELLREISSITQFTSSPRDSQHVGPISPDRMEIEGIAVIFSNPERWDTRRGEMF